MSSVQEILSQSSIIDSTIKLIDINQVMFDKRDGELAIGEFILTNRAIKNIGRWLGVPKSLLEELSIPLLNQTIKEQCTRRGFSKFRMGFPGEDSNKILFLQPEQVSYIRYEKVLEPFIKKILWVKGSPLVDDVLRIFLREMDLSPKGEELIVGQQIKLSSILIEKPVLSMGLFRLICSNGLISKKFAETYKVEEENLTSSILESLVSSRQEEATNFAKEINNFVDISDEYIIESPVEAVMEEIDEMNLISKTVTKEARTTGELIKKGDQTFVKVGLPKLDTLWNYTNLLSWQSQMLTSFSSRERAETGIYSWASFKLTQSQKN